VQIHDSTTEGTDVHIKLADDSATEKLPRRGLSESEAADYIGMSRSFLRQARMDGHRQYRTPGPPYTQIGRKILYLKDDLDSWLERHRRT
jgi:hypothetical protein